MENGSRVHEEQIDGRDEQNEGNDCHAKRSEVVLVVPDDLTHLYSATRQGQEINESTNTKHYRDGYERRPAFHESLAYDRRPGERGPFRFTRLLFANEHFPVLEHVEGVLVQRQWLCNDDGLTLQFAFDQVPESMSPDIRGIHAQARKQAPPIVRHRCRPNHPIPGKSFRLQFNELADTVSDLPDPTEEEYQDKKNEKEIDEGRWIVEVRREPAIQISCKDLGQRWGLVIHVVHLVRLSSSDAHAGFMKVLFAEADVPLGHDTRRFMMFWIE